jgi:hypothetical protein
MVPVTEMQSTPYNFQMANANKLASRCLSQKNKKSMWKGGRGERGGLSQMFEDYYEGECTKLLNNFTFHV